MEGGCQVLPDAPEMVGPAGGDRRWALLAASAGVVAYSALRCVQGPCQVVADVPDNRGAMKRTALRQPRAHAGRSVATTNDSGLRCGPRNPTLRCIDHRVVHTWYLRQCQGLGSLRPRSKDPCPGRRAPADWEEKNRRPGKLLAQPVLCCNPWVSNDHRDDGVTTGFLAAFDCVTV